MFNVQNITLPEKKRLETLPLYVSPVNFKYRSHSQDNGSFTDSMAEKALQKHQVNFKKAISRYSRNDFTLNAREKVSFGTFFNAFPIAFWKNFTNQSEVSLLGLVSSEVDIAIFISNEKAEVVYEKTYKKLSGEVSLKIDFAVASSKGGYAWFEIKAGKKAAKITNLHWAVKSIDVMKKYKASIGITTFNNPDECVRQMKRFADDKETLKLIREIIIVDQGTDKLKDSKKFGAARKELGKQFRLIEQANMGGSGGFARGQLEAVLGGVSGKEKKADAVIMLDDDVQIETESIRRAIIFAAYCKKPTLVGGHMIDLDYPTRVHNMGERINEKDWIWRAIDEKPLLETSLYSMVKELQFSYRHQPTHNGWWMCLIPAEVVRKIGLSFPGFIKWDDVEYGWRAMQAGYETVTLPSVGLWHLGWTGKNDQWDWQAYYHERNRWVTALIHSSYGDGGKMPAISKRIDQAFLTAMHYGAVELRLMGLEDVLRGPSHLHKTIATQNAKIREIIKQSDDGKVYDLKKDKEAFGEYQQNCNKDYVAPLPPSKIRRLLLGANALLHNYLYKPGKDGKKIVSSSEAGWWQTYRGDEVKVYGINGQNLFIYHRNPAEFRRLMKKSRKLHRELNRKWPELSAEYKCEFKKLVSPEEWKKTFKKDGHA